MKKLFFIIAFIIGGLTVSAEIEWPQTKLAHELGIADQDLPEDCDTIIDFKGYNVRVLKRDGRIRNVGLALFPEEMKKQNDRRLLNYIETSLLAYCNGYDFPRKDEIWIEGGKPEDFKQITPQTDITFSSTKSRYIDVAWTLPDGKQLKLQMPLSYDVSLDGTRTDVENQFIRQVREGLLERQPFPKYSESKLKDYSGSNYILPGKYYETREINRNVYFDLQGPGIPLWNTNYPRESIANMFIFPSDSYGDTEIDLTFLKHDYGVTENLTVPVNQFLAAAEDEGCIPYWGIESFSNDKLEGALFLYNENRGYVHVVKIDCNPEEIIEKHGKLKGRVSLYIPTNNIHDLFQPYIHKTAKERIKY